MIANFQRAIILVCCTLGSSGLVLAVTEATTKSGEQVLLHDDFTWEYVDDSEDQEVEARINLSVVSAETRHGNCVVGLQLKNNAPYRIVSLVPQFAAYVQDDVHFDNVFVSFQNVNPTLDQYQELVIRRTACGEVTRIRVHGGDRCNMEVLNKYSPGKGECLKRVRVEPSDLVNIAK